jgi:hypothetical protein
MVITSLTSAKKPVLVQRSVAMVLGDRLIGSVQVTGLPQYIAMCLHIIRPLISLPRTPW